MTLLSIVQNACDELGIVRPTSVASSTDQQVRQVFALLNREGKTLSTRHTWERLKKEATHTTLAAELQGAMTTITGTDFQYMLNGTMWNRTQNRPVAGPLSATDWQLLKSSSVSGPWESFYIRGGNLYFIPAPAAGETIAFEWVSKNWCESSGGTGKTAFTADDDIGLLPEDLLGMGVVWRWLKAKGFDYSEEFRSYEMELMNYIGRDGGREILRTDGQTRRAGIVVPEGSWSL